MFYFYSRLWKQLFHFLRLSTTLGIQKSGMLPPIFALNQTLNFWSRASVQEPVDMPASDFANKFPASEALGCRNMQIPFWGLIPFVGTNGVSPRKRSRRIVVLALFSRLNRRAWLQDYAYADCFWQTKLVTERM